MAQVVDNNAPAQLTAITRDLILTLDQVTSKDIASVGGKGASLGEMTKAGAPVPPAFIVTTAAYQEFMERDHLFELVGGILAGIDVNESTALDRAAVRIQRAILAAPMPAAIEAAIENAYRRLGLGPVAVRSSATAEDLPGASFAGQQRTFLNVEGGINVVRAVQACWASLFEARAIFYRETNGFNHADVSIAVPVQRMVASEASGVMFTVDPADGNTDRILIEAVYGLGEPLVSGELSPDAYMISKGDTRIVKRELVVQPWLLRRGLAAGGYEYGSVRSPVPPEAQQAQKLSDELILALAEFGKRLEAHYGCPQDVEWAMERDQIYIVQSRPITTLKQAAAAAPCIAETVTAGLTPVLSGSPASPGVGAGPVRIVRDPSEIHLVQKGDILVTEMTTPDFVPAMKRAAGIVTDRGGRTCHAAIVSREMGIPCVVGTGTATAALRDVGVVTVDGAAGKVYSGDLTKTLAPAPGNDTYEKIATQTRLYVNLADPDAAGRGAALDVDGVGLLRAEFIMAHIGEHPRAMLQSGRGAEFTQRLAEGLETFARSFAPRPVVYRFSDFKTNEYRNLRGGEAFEPHEENPMIGYRGCGRYLAEPDLFALETAAVKQVRREFPNLWVMVPFVRTVEELKGVVRLMEQSHLKRGPGFKLWMMLEVPSNVIILDDFLDVGVDGVSIGSNDLTQLTLGVDRDNERLAAIFDERDAAVLASLERVVRGCAARGVTVSICGQAPSVYPELTQKLVSWGITSISVSPDMIGKTRHIIHEAEARKALADFKKDRHVFKNHVRQAVR